ncbi:uncharacterized protein LOC119106894, partial [Pollicipes pollicipes]|uniref:uncharacterized protein LOC119106894 n=1 Tax=Pollicipes pollicipes TaxID=41117 RepID=UPI0018853241
MKSVADTEQPALQDASGRKAPIAGDDVRGNTEVEHDTSVTQLESQALEDVLRLSEGTPVKAPHIETQEEEGVDDKGRKVTLRTVYITIVEEIVTLSGEKVLVKKIHKKTQKVTEEEDGTHLVEHTAEPPIVIDDLSLADVGDFSEEPASTSERAVKCEEPDNVRESLQPQYDSTHTEVPVKPETAPAPHQIVGDTSLVQECVTSLTGSMIEEPNVETTEEETVDEHGHPVRIKRIFVTVVEEVTDETGAKRIVKRIVKKAQKTSEVSGKPVTEDIEEPVDEPTDDQLEKEAVRQMVPEDVSLVGEPQVRTTVEETVDKAGKPVIFKRIYVTIFEEVADESGKVRVVKRLLKKNRKVTEVDGRITVEEYDDPEESETMATSVPDMTESSVAEECLPALTGSVVEEPKVETTVEETVDEHGHPVRIKRIFVTITEEVTDETGSKRVVKRIVKKAQKTSEVNGIPVTEDVEEMNDEPSNDQLEQQILEQIVPKEKMSLVGEPQVKTTVEEAVDKSGRPVLHKRIYVTIFDEVTDESGKNKVIRRVLKKNRKITEVDGKPVIEEYDEPEESEVVLTSVPVMTESSFAGEVLPALAGAIVGEPKLETNVEETVDKDGRPVKIKRIFVTVIEEVVDETGTKRFVKRVVKKTQKTSEVNGKPVTEDMEEPMDEPTNDQLEKQIVEQMIPKENVSLVGEPQVKTTVEETVDKAGRPVIHKRFFITIFEEVT